MGLFSSFRKNGNVEWKKIQSRIYPFIKVNIQEKIKNVNETVELDIPMIPFVDNLMVVFVIEQRDSFEIVQRQMLPETMTDYELYQIACQNLERDISLNFVQNEETGYYGVLAGGNFEASSLCLNSVWEYFLQNIGENLIFSIPSKDVVLIVGESQKEALEELKKMTSEIYENGDGILSEQLFIYNKESKKMSIYNQLIKSVMYTDFFVLIF